MIPADVLEVIAFHGAALNKIGPPTVLISLLATCRSLNYSLSFQNNRGLYADIFRLKFDTAAPTRRFGPELGVSRLSSFGLASELRSRYTTLAFMRTVIRNKDAVSPSEGEMKRHLWTMYFMCLESDEKNARELFEYGGLKPFVRICMEQRFLPLLDISLLIPASIELALITWILWLSTSWGTLTVHTNPHCYPWLA